MGRGPTGQPAADIRAGSACITGSRSHNANNANNSTAWAGCCLCYSDLPVIQTRLPGRIRTWQGHADPRPRCPAVSEAQAERWQNFLWRSWQRRKAQVWIVSAMSDAILTDCSESLKICKTPSFSRVSPPGHSNGQVVKGKAGCCGASLRSAPHHPAFPSAPLEPPSNTHMAIGTPPYRPSQAPRGPFSEPPPPTTPLVWRPAGRRLTLRSRAGRLLRQMRYAGCPTGRSLSYK